MRRQQRLEAESKEAQCRREAAAKQLHEQQHENLQKLKEELKVERQGHGGSAAAGAGADRLPQQQLAAHLYRCASGGDGGDGEHSPL